MKSSPSNNLKEELGDILDGYAFAKLKNKDLAIDDALNLILDTISARPEMQEIMECDNFCELQQVPAGLVDGLGEKCTCGMKKRRADLRAMLEGLRNG